MTSAPPPAPDNAMRAARGGAAGDGGGGGTGGQSRHGDDSGAHAGNSHDTVDIKAQQMQPVPAPQPGALTVRVSAAEAGTVHPEQLVEDWFAGFASLRKRLAAHPNAAIDATILEKMLDKFEALRHVGALPVQGMGKWRQMLIDERDGSPVSHPSTASKSTPPGPRDETVAATANEKLNRLQRFNALLPLLLFELDLPSPPSRAAVSVNLLTTIRGAALAKQSKR